MSDIDYKPIIKRMIILSWAFLGVCFLLKLFGANIFKCYTDNEAFKTFCKLTETFLPLKYLVCVVSSLITSFLFWLSIKREKWFASKRETLISLFTVLLTTLFKLIFPQISVVFDVYSMIIFPMILLGKPSKKWFNILIVFASYVMFALISLFVKEVSLNSTMTNNTYIALLSSVDTWIMELLLYFYFSWGKGEE